jgi:hypothetical protein
MVKEVKERNEKVAAISLFDSELILHLFVPEL